MADVPNTTQCKNGDCGHPGSMHQDTTDGKNSGACTAQGCDCSGMKQGASAPPPPPAKKAAAAAVNEQLADTVPVPSGSDAPSGDAPADPPTLAAAVDDGIDQAIDLLTGIDPSAMTPNLQQFLALVQAADNSIDCAQSALGVSDDDNDVTTTVTDPAAFVQAADAALDAAMNALEGVDTSQFPAEAGQAIDLIKQAQTDAGSLLAALNLPDPDDDPGYKGGGGSGDAPAPAPADDQSASTSTADFAEGDVVQSGADGTTPEVPSEDTESLIEFDIPIMVLEGVDTGDGRRIDPQALSWRDLPLPLMAITETGYGHEGAQLVGRIVEITRVDASGMINPKTGEPYGEGVQALAASGEFSDIAQAQTIADLVGDGFLRGVSVDVGDVVSEFIPDETEGGDEEDDLMDILFGFGGTEVVKEGRVMGATVCPFPAFEGAYIQLKNGASTPQTQEEADQPEVPITVAASGAELKVKRIALRFTDVPGERRCIPCQEGGSMVASAGPMYPPRSWFEMPEADQITPLTITDDGRVFGHVAAWRECHTGVSNQCVMAPRSKTDYAFFHKGQLKTAEGNFLDVGTLTMDTGHADMQLGMGPAMAHYDDTGTGVADLRAVDGKLGIWVSGAVRPDVTELQVRKLRASGPSGDWRNRAGNLEMIGLLAVNVQGFPIPRSLAASGVQLSLTAAGGQEVIRHAAFGYDPKMRQRLDELAVSAEWVNVIVRERVETLRNRVHGKRLAALRERAHR